MRTDQDVLKEKRIRAVDLLTPEEQELRCKYLQVCKRGGAVTPAMRAAEAAYKRALKLVNEEYKRRQLANAKHWHRDRRQRDPEYRALENKEKRERHRRYQNDPEFRARKREYDARRRARKKAERLLGDSGRKDGFGSGLIPRAFVDLGLTG